MYTCHGIIGLIQHLADVYLPWDHLVNTTLNRCLLAMDHLVNTTRNRCLVAMGSFG